MKARRLELKDLGNGWAYKDIIQFIAGCPETGHALNYAEIVKRGDLVDDAERAEGELLLDPQKHELLVRLAKGFNWPMFSSSGILNKKALDNIRQFVMELENAELVEVGTAQKKEA